MAALLTVKHNIEVAHRLSMTPGKCENIHGHSMIVDLSISGDLGPNGLLLINPGRYSKQPHDRMPLEFGELKLWFRQILDGMLDHKLLLNVEDSLQTLPIPGMVKFPYEPTTENIARWIYEAAYRQYVQMELQPVAGRSNIIVTVQETAVNSATYGDF